MLYVTALVLFALTAQYEPACKVCNLFSVKQEAIVADFCLLSYLSSLFFIFYGGFVYTSALGYNLGSYLQHVRLRDMTILRDQVLAIKVKIMKYERQVRLA